MIRHGRLTEGAGFHKIYFGRVVPKCVFCGDTMALSGKMHFSQAKSRKEKVKNDIETIRWFDATVPGNFPKRGNLAYTKGIRELSL